jgi:transcriptional regulator with XRE-family HTH domain
MPLNEVAPSLLEFGRRVRQARDGLGLSQEALAAKSGFHRTYIGAIERGKRNPALLNILKLSAALDTDACRLVEGLK